MNRNRLNIIFQYAYSALVGVFGVSVVLAALMYGIVYLGGYSLAPLDGDGAGRAALLGPLPSTSGALAGERVAAAGGSMYVVAHEVASISRENGLLYVQTQTGATLAARDLYRSVVMTMPLVGYWLAALTHPIGLAALVGMPLLMILIDLLQIVLGSSLLTRMRSVRLPQAGSMTDDELSVTLPQRRHELTMHV